MNDPTDRVALVTGASRGIGRTVAEKLGMTGALVAVHYVDNHDAAQESAEAVTAAGGEAFTVASDLAEPDGVDRLVEGLHAGVKERRDEVSLDILVNNAGIMGGVTPDELTPELFDQLMTVNAKAPLFLVQQLAPMMRDGGRIVNVSSGLTRMAMPQEVGYAMTKAALEMVSLHFARHLSGRGITVNTVAPGVTDNGSSMLQVPEVREAMAQTTAFGRIGEPADVADVVAFLASEQSRWITGAFVDASGGTLLG